MTRRSQANIRRAIAMRMDGATWAAIADELGITTRTIRNWRHHQDWADEIEGQISALISDGRLIAWQTLVDAARTGHVWAARTILERADGLGRIQVDADVTHDLEPWWAAVEKAQQRALHERADQSTHELPDADESGA